MLPDQDALDSSVLDLVGSDFELLELSISDLIIAFGGQPKPIDFGYIEKLKSGKLFECFSRRVRNNRIYKYYGVFKTLDLQVDSFFRILKLHINRGFSFLDKFKAFPETIKLFCLCYVDVVFDLYYGIVKQVIDFTLHDCVYIYKFFLNFDRSLLLHNIKHVYIRDEIYDLILHSLWFALKDAWWLYLNPKFLKPLFPFISHMRVDKCYDLTIHDINHVLHNIHFVTLISQDIAFQSETATLVDSASIKDDSELLPKPFEDASVHFEDISKQNLQIKYLRGVNSFGLVEPEDKDGPFESNYDLSLDLQNENLVTNLENDDSGTNSQLPGVLDFDKRLSDCETSEYSSPEPCWPQVTYIVVVGFIYICLFESYLNVVSENLKKKMKPIEFLDFLVKRLEDLIQITNLILEVDCNFTAWAQDKLGSCSDDYLLKCFNTYSEQIFSGDKFRDTNIFENRPDGFRTDIRGKLMNLSHEMDMYLLAPTLERSKKVQYDIVRMISTLSSRPCLRFIDNIYFIEESNLYHQILYNTQNYFIGPTGPLSESCRQLPLKFKRAIFVETFYNIVINYANIVVDNDCYPCEAVIYDSMSIWDSILDFFDYSTNPQILEEECVKLLADILDQIKFTSEIDLNQLELFKSKFRYNFFTLPRKSGSMLSFYAYNCLSFVVDHCYEGSKSETNKNVSATEDVLSNFMDKHAVWLDGIRRKRMVTFGKTIFFFRDNSLLQPVGFITFDSIYSILAPHTLVQVHPNVQILENNSENDSFSCGTSESSDPVQGSVFYNKSDSLDYSSSYLLEERDYDLRIENVGENTNELDNKVPKIYNFSVQDATCMSANAYCGLGDNSLLLFKRGNASTKTRFSGKSSGGSSFFDNMQVWGWQLRLELLDSCVLNDLSNFDVVVDLEFTSPEYRKFWEHQIRDKTKANSQCISWPYHTFFFDSI